MTVETFRSIQNLKSMLLFLKSKNALNMLADLKIINHGVLFIAMRNFRKQLKRSLLMLPLLFMAVGCSEKMTDASISGYNHSATLHIYQFYVNGAMGSNFQPLTGGGETCCVSIPDVWRPGLKAKISVEYDSAQDDPNPPPPSQEIEVEIQKYHRPGKLWVHFYDNHQVKIVISNCSIEHPFYPMTDKDKLPWKASGTKKERLEIAKPGSNDNDC